MYLHRTAQQEKPPLGAVPRIKLGPALQQADALPTELRCTITFCPYTGDIFAKNQMTGILKKEKNTIIYKIDAVKFHVTCILDAAVYGRRSFLLLSLVFSTSGPSGLGGRLGARL